MSSPLGLSRSAIRFAHAGLIDGWKAQKNLRACMIDDPSNGQDIIFFIRKAILTSGSLLLGLGYDHARVVEDEVEQLRRLPGEEVRHDEGEQAPVGRRGGPPQFWRRNPLFCLRNGALADVKADDEATGAGERHHVVPLHELSPHQSKARCIAARS